MVDTVATAATQTADAEPLFAGPETPDPPSPTPIGSLVAPPVTIAKQHHDESIVKYEDEYEKLNSAYQVAWNKVMEKGPLTSASYESAAALLISWDEPFDDLHVKKEVDSLGAIFTKTFNYTVRKVYLNSSNRATPQVQVNSHVAKFVEEEDDARRLLIVYYAGHGTPGHSPGSLELQPGYATQDDAKGRLNKIIWNRTENLLQDTRADVLEIFDCCYAGSLGIRSPPTHSFEYLAGTGPNQTAKCPGPNSFTSALIWALQQLVNERECFTTQQLMHKIKKDAPEFPRDQTPVLSKRGNQNTANCIILQPISRSTEPVPLTRPGRTGSQDTGATEGPTPEVLTLKFIFKSRPAIPVVQELGKVLMDVMMEHDFKVRRIMWGGLHSWARLSLAEAAQRFMLGSNHRPRRFGPGSSPETLLIPLQGQEAGTQQKHGSSSEGSHYNGLYEHKIHKEYTHGIVYHWKMLLSEIWLAFISFAGLFAAIFYAFLAAGPSIEDTRFWPPPFQFVLSKGRI